VCAYLFINKAAVLKKERILLLSSFGSKQTNVWRDTRAYTTLICLLVKLINGLQTTLCLYEIATSLRLIQSNWLALFFTHGALTKFLGTLLTYTQVTAILKQMSSDAVYANYALTLLLQLAGFFEQ